MSDPIVPNPPKDVKPDQSFEVHLTSIFITVRWWPWGPPWASYTINKRADFDDTGGKLLAAEILGGPAWSQPRPAEWVQDVADKMKAAANKAETLDRLIRNRSDFQRIEVTRDKLIVHLHRDREGFLYFPADLTTIIDERKPKEADDE